MKIIRITALAPCLDVDFHPDSALLLPGRPFFMPDFGEGWKARVYLAVRIGRLGKNISEKFASRYYDGLSLALHVSLPASDLSEGLLSGMDSTLVHGDWIAASALESPLAVACDDLELTLPPAAPIVDGLINKVSGFTTLKMGDILLLPVEPLTEFPLAERTRHRLTLNGADNLDLKIV